MEVDPCNQSESGKLASSLALSEEAALLDSPNEEARNVGHPFWGVHQRRRQSRMSTYHMIIRRGGRGKKFS